MNWRCGANLLVPERARAIHVGQRTAYENNPHARPIRDGLDLRARRKDGREFPVSIMLGPITGRGDDRTMAVIRDLAATEATRRLWYTDQLTGLARSRRRAASTDFFGDSDPERTSHPARPCADARPDHDPSLMTMSAQNASHLTARQQRRL